MPEHTALEPRLRELGRFLDVPPPPDVTVSVRTRLAAPSTVRHEQPRWLYRAAAVLALLAVASAALASSPRVRAAVTEVLHFAGIDVTSAPGPTPRATPSPPGQAHSTLADARRRARFRVTVPATLGLPDEVVISDGDPPRVVSLLYRPGAGRPATGTGGVAVALDEFDGTLGPVFQKYALTRSAEEVAVGPYRGLWVRGPHEVVYVDRNGSVLSESARLAGNTLIWEARGVTLRLEGAYSREQAIAVAVSVQ